jgi:hypothetical protein
MNTLKTVNETREEIKNFSDETILKLKKITVLDTHNSINLYAAVKMEIISRHL